MWHEQNQAAGGYLSRVLSDTAKPFRYRSGPRSLLGVVSGKETGKLAFSPTLPPAGFRFLDQSFNDNPYALKSILNESGLPSPFNNQEAEAVKTGGTLKEKIEQIDSVNEARIEIPGFSKKDDFYNLGNELWEDSITLKYVDQQQKIVSGSKEKSISFQSNKGIGQENVEIEKANYHLHGLTEKGKTPSSTPSPIKKNNALLNYTETPRSVKNVGELSEKIEKKEKHKNFSLKLKNNLIEPSFASENRTSVNHDIHTGTIFSIRKKKTASEGQHVEKSSILQDSDNTWHVEAARDNIKFTTDKNSLSEKQNPSRIISENRRVLNKHLSPLISGPIGADAVNRSGVSAENEISRVRNAVQDSIIRKTAGQERQYNDSSLHTPERIKPAPAQQVVIVRQASNPGTRTPCAFWDRSYLGHFYRRILR